jgi:murein DD-endopeptidase
MKILFLFTFLFYFSHVGSEQIKVSPKKNDVAVNHKPHSTKEKAEEKGKKSKNEEKSSPVKIEEKSNTKNQIGSKHDSKKERNEKKEYKKLKEEVRKEPKTSTLIASLHSIDKPIKSSKELKEKLSKKNFPIPTKETHSQKPSPIYPKKEESTPLSDTFEEMNFKEEEYTITARANEFRQGNLAFIKIKEKKGKPKIDPSILFAKWSDKYIPLHFYKDSYLGILPISPEHPVGSSFLEIEKREDDKTTIYKFPISIAKTNFPERKMYNPLRIPKKYILKEHSPETLEFIKKCEDKKQQAFSLDTELKISGKFVLPLDKIFVTSPFYVKRYYHPTSPGKPHGGVDLRGKPGVPIYALQDGKVVIAERMFYEGIFTVIDHGSKVFTLYMHQSKLHVKEGDMVKAGDLIGEVGSTGVSTGPHLHLGLKVDGNIINPLSILQLSLFE